jgi:hypothetical protein
MAAALTGLRWTPHLWLCLLLLLAFSFVAITHRWFNRQSPLMISASLGFGTCIVVKEYVLAKCNLSMSDFR